MITKQQIEWYFTAEKTASMVLMILGALAIACTLLLCFIIKTPFYRGLFITVAAVAIVHLVVGYSVYNRSDAQRKTMVYRMDMNPEAIRLQEIPRMEKVMQNFKSLRLGAIVFLIAGAFLFVWARSQEAKEILMGAGIGLLLQMSVSLAFDWVAESRARIYLNGLTEWANKP